MSALEGSVQLSARRAGLGDHSDAGVKTKGVGAELDQSFVDELRSELADLRGTWPDGFKNDKERNVFEGKAARIVHAAVPSDSEMLSDPEFWIWLAVVCFPELVEWRYGNPEGGTKLANYGVGSRTENLLYRLWLRAELTLDDQHEDRYHLAEAGQIDFYRSHLFRQGYANARNFARALLRYQYPSKDVAAPRLKILQIRDLVKRLCRMRSNLFLEILPEEECRAVIVAEAKVLAFE
ncbi:DUF6339 family protein [Variovorax paradoxus]